MYLKTDKFFPFLTVSSILDNHKSLLEKKTAFSMFSYVFNENKIEFEPQDMITIFPLGLNTQLVTRQTIASKNKSIKIIKFLHI